MSELLTRLRLHQLVSPSLPVGAFAWSQGLEWAVEQGWVNDETTLEAWLRDLLTSAISQFDLPLLFRLYRAREQDDATRFAYWSAVVIAGRESDELRQEERQRGRALATLMPELGIPRPAALEAGLAGCALAGYAHICHHWRIPPDQAAAGHLWSWLENSTLTGIKIIPLGQSAGQRIVTRLTPLVDQALQRAQGIDDEQIGASAPAQAVASANHESQYTRIYRS